MTAAGEGSATAPRPRRVGAWILVLAYAGLIFWLSSQANPLPFLPRAWLARDKVLHALEYAGLGALLFVALRGRGPRAWRLALLAAVLASLYGASDEWHQSFVPGRDADPLDWAADSAGALAGATIVGPALAAAFLRRRPGAG
ncbi:MAG TPA: VanZ family protein [Anaeromyxobacter sp.]|nr:VanZ family protein [Anaeromyxobacter sp.]